MVGTSSEANTLACGALRTEIMVKGMIVLLSTQQVKALFELPAPREIIGGKNLQRLHRSSLHHLFTKGTLRRSLTCELQICQTTI
jgi:hypothetical protein